MPGFKISASGSDGNRLLNQSNVRSDANDQESSMKPICDMQRGTLFLSSLSFEPALIPSLTSSLVT
jgi:hypothetical protein